MIRKIPKAVWTFLTRERRLPFRRAQAPRPRRKRRGIALPTALFMIAIAGVVAMQFTSTTTIDLMAAANYRDQMRAHFLARSAVNLSEFVIRLQQKLDGASAQLPQLKGVQVTDFADQLLLAFCGAGDELKAAVGNAAEYSKGLGADIGVCGIVERAITTEDDKLNINCANTANWQTTKSALDALLFFNAYDPVFEEADAENWRRDRTLQVSALIDYVDSDTVRLRDRGTAEDYGYESLKDDYRAKNTYIDTIGELKLVRGVDDRFWNLFGSSFTTYGACKINLSALTNVQLIAAVLYLSAKNQNDPMLLDPQKLFALAGLVAKAKLFGMQFGSTDDFVDFVKDPAKSVDALAATAGMAGSQAQAAKQAGAILPGGQKLGMELDKAKLGQMASTGPRRTYRVRAYGEIERPAKDADGNPIFPPIRVTLTGVWDTRVVNQNVRKQPALKGAWVFLRED